MKKRWEKVVSCDRGASGDGTERGEGSNEECCRVTVPNFRANLVWDEVHFTIVCDVGAI